MNVRNFLLLLMLLSAPKMQAQADYERNFEKFRQYYTLLRHHYVDTVNFDKIVETAIVKSLETLDPHSAYLEPKIASSENDRLKGNFEGIGIMYNVAKDTLKVVEVIAGGPSEKVGLMVGDQLIKINDTVWAGKNLLKSEDYVSRLKGKKGTKVNVSVLRGTQLLDFTITRDIIPLNSVDIATMLDKETGYIKLNKFSGTTPHEMQQALTELQSKGMKNLILDLQNNGGGLLQAAVSLCDEFLESNSLVVYTEGVHYPKQTFSTGENGLMRKGKLIVLINENSASASEITAGAIQDWDRGLIVGRRSFGKGLVQKPFALIDNSQLRLTISEYYTPSGRFIQKPYNNGIKEYREELLHRAQAGLLTKSDISVPPENLMKLTLKNKRKVYGGGGIMPDVYVPQDTSYQSEYYMKLFRKGIVNEFVTKFSDKNRTEIKAKYPTVDEYAQFYNVYDTDLEQLYQMGDSSKIARDSAMTQPQLKLVKTALKANIGRSVYGSVAFYKVIMDIDPIILRGLAAIRENFSKYKVRND